MRFLSIVVTVSHGVYDLLYSSKKAGGSMTIKDVPGSGDNSDPLESRANFSGIDQFKLKNTVLYAFRP